MDAEHARLRVQGNLTLVNAKILKTLGKRVALVDDEQQRRRRNAETKPIETHDHWTQVQVQRIPNRNDFKPTMKTDVANLAEQVDEDTSLRTPATSHPLVLDAEENVSKKSRVARNVLYISVVRTS